jgi:neutral ceramidase
MANASGQNKFAVMTTTNTTFHFAQESRCRFGPLKHPICRQVLECGSPLPLSSPHDFPSGRGLPHSKTRARSIKPRATSTRAWFWRIGTLLSAFVLAIHSVSAAEDATWRVGTAQAKITPPELLWMGGFASRTKPAEGKLDDLWAKVLVLEASDGGVGVLVTADLVGVPKWLYENLCRELSRRHGLVRGQLRFAASHTHSGPVLKDALQDIYPLDDQQRKLIAEYSAWIEPVLLEAITQAFTNRSPATLWAGEGRATFALNRRTNDEGKLAQLLARGESPKGPSDFAVPVLAVRSPDGKLRTVVFGYAAHTSALTQNQLWSADYCGVTMQAVEAKHPGAAAMFFQGCGSDQSAAPRGTVALCRQRGDDLAAAVQAVLEKPMRPLAPKLRTAFEFVALDFGEQPSADELGKLGQGSDYRARWARRLSAELAAGKSFARSYPEYPVQVWKLGSDQLWIALGGEVCVDYALRFKREYGSNIWVNGYANDVMAYIPSRRLWEEGGYQAGAFEVYGLPATRWCPDIEDRIVGAVARLVGKVR